MSARVALRMGGVVLCVGLVACGSEGRGPTNPRSDSIPSGPTDAIVSLASSTEDGAVLLRVTGPGFGTPRVTGTGTTVHWRLVSESELMVAVFGVIHGGELFRVAIPDGPSIGAYQAALIQVASKTDNLRSDMSGYALRVSIAE